jgi:hypothetical protein
LLKHWNEAVHFASAWHAVCSGQHAEAMQPRHGFGCAAHATPLVHLPPTQYLEQHSVYAEQADPSGLHGLAPQVPPSHACEQHSLGDEHATPSGLHGGGVPAHLPALQVFEQQLTSHPHEAPSGSHRPVGAHTPAEQLPVQHDAGLEQLPQTGVQGASPQTPAEHLFEQHSAGAAHEAPFGLQTGGSTGVSGGPASVCPAEPPLPDEASGFPAAPAEPAAPATPPVPATPAVPAPPSASPPLVPAAPWPA